MDLTIWIISLIIILIILIFAIAQYGKESKLKDICRKIARELLLGFITIRDEDRKSFFQKKH